MWANIGLIIVGSLGGGIILTIINLLLLAPLVPAWFIVGRILPGSGRWAVYLACVGAWLMWVFAVHRPLPWFVVVMSGLGLPLAWFAVLGGVFFSGLSGSLFLARLESGLRAAHMAILALYFVTVMYGVVFIEMELGHI